MSNSKSRPEKRRRRSIIAFEMIRLDRTATEPLREQLYRQVRDELKSGRFSDGSSLLVRLRVWKSDSASSTWSSCRGKRFCAPSCFVLCRQRRRENFYGGEQKRTEPAFLPIRAGVNFYVRAGKRKSSA
jgi:hypothetical protein